MRILPLIFVVALAVCGAAAVAAARAQGDEARAHRPLLKRGLLAKSKTTTTTTAAPQEEEVEYEEYADGEEGQEASTEAPPSSTEGKKLVAGGVRPFRSNTDLLETLKRRRAQAAEAKLHGHSAVTSAPAQPHEAAAEPASAPAPAKASYNQPKLGRKLSSSPPPASQRLQYHTTPARRHSLNSVPKEVTEKKVPMGTIEPAVEKRPTNTRNGRHRQAVTEYETLQTTPYPRKSQRKESSGKKRFNNSPKESNVEETPALVKPSRNRFSRPSARSVQEDHEEQNESAPAPARIGRTFSRKN